MAGESRSRGRRRSGGRRRSRSKGSSDRSTMHIAAPEGPPMTCAICGEVIRDVYSAVASGEEQTACHFECVLRQIQADRMLKPDEKVSYLGSGTFAVIRTTGSGGFTVTERIRYEDETNRPEWRRRLRRVHPS